MPRASSEENTSLCGAELARHRRAVFSAFAHLEAEVTAALANLRARINLPPRPGSAPKPPAGPLHAAMASAPRKSLEQNRPRHLARAQSSQFFPAGSFLRSVAARSSQPRNGSRIPLTGRARRPARALEEVNESHEGKRKTESLCPVHQINWQRSRYVFDMFYKYKKINRETYDYCIRNKLVDESLIAKWKKPGYERLCSTYMCEPGW